ncbi:MAG: hemerythrin domain-containing protein [Deltaproteobacteria bacterium]|nr:hemerythrin domain-containing protein [Deltaproteobacteria bacterium]
MPKFIQTLKNDHRIILLLLKKSSNPNLTNEERTAFLTTIKFLISDHFETENKDLYPVLFNNIDKNDEISKTAKSFMNGLLSLGNIIDNFFTKHVKDPKDLHRDSDFPKIVKLLETRIKQEEKELYPLYNEIVTEN